MGNAFLDIILFAAIAAFLIFRLRSVLGRRTGHEQPPKYDPHRDRESEESAQEKVIQLPDRKARREGEDESFEEEMDAAPSDSPLEAGLAQIQRADRNFDAEAFLGGAKTAFEMIVAAFAEGDTKALRPLLSNDVYEEFAEAIDARAEADQTLETTLVGVFEAEIIEADLQSKTAFITLKFASEQINVTRDAEGTIVDDDPNQIASVTDIWTFARNTRSRDPNWTLVATRSSN